MVVAVETEDELADLDLTFLPVLDPAPEHGANVEFVLPGDPLIKDGVGEITMRVHERGRARRSRAAPGRRRCPRDALLGRCGGAGHLARAGAGRLLTVRMTATEDGEHVSLSGPAELVFSGDLTV